MYLTLDHFLALFQKKIFWPIEKLKILEKISKFSNSELKAVKAAAPSVCSTLIEKMGYERKLNSNRKMGYECKLTSTRKWGMSIRSTEKEKWGLSVHSTVIEKWGLSVH